MCTHLHEPPLSVYVYTRCCVCVYVFSFSVQQSAGQPMPSCASCSILQGAGTSNSSSSGSSRNDSSRSGSNSSSSNSSVRNSNSTLFLHNLCSVHVEVLRGLQVPAMDYDGFRNLLCVEVLRALQGPGMHHDGFRIAPLSDGSLATLLRFMTEDQIRACFTSACEAIVSGSGGEWQTWSRNEDGDSLEFTLAQTFDPPSVGL